MCSAGGHSHLEPSLAEKGPHTQASRPRVKGKDTGMTRPQRSREKTPELQDQRAMGLRAQPRFPSGKGGPQGPPQPSGPRQAPQGTTRRGPEEEGPVLSPITPTSVHITHHPCALLQSGQAPQAEKKPAGAVEQQQGLKSEPSLGAGGRVPSHLLGPALPAGNTDSAQGPH